MQELTFNELCGKKIQEARIAKNMSVQDLAYAIDPDNYEKTTKLIKYWERGNGFPDLNQIYKLADVIDIDPNMIFKLRENGRKSLSEVKQLTDKQVIRRERIQANFDDFALLWPAIVMTLGIVFVFKGWGAIWGFFEDLSRFFGFIS